MVIISKFFLGNLRMVAFRMVESLQYIVSDDPNGLDEQDAFLVLFLAMMIYFHVATCVDVYYGFFSFLLMRCDFYADWS